MADGGIEGVLYDLRASNHGDCTYDVEAGADSGIKERASIGTLIFYLLYVVELLGNQILSRANIEYGSDTGVSVLIRNRSGQATPS